MIAPRRRRRRRPSIPRARRSRSTETFVTTRPVASVWRRVTFALVSSVTFGWRQRRLDAADVRVRLGLDEAREPVAGLAADALASARRSFSFSMMPSGTWKGGGPFCAKSSARCWMRGSCRRRARDRGRSPAARSGPRRGCRGRCRAARPRVVGLHLVVGDRPGRRDAAVVADLAEVLLAQAEEGGAVEFGVPADVVVRVRMELLAVLVAPDFLRGVLAVDVDGLRAPVVLLAGDEVAALEHQDPLAGRGERPEQRPAAGARADDDDVVVVAGHQRPLSRRPRPAGRTAGSRTGRCSARRSRGGAWRRGPSARRASRRRSSAASEHAERRRDEVDPEVVPPHRGRRRAEACAPGSCSCRKAAPRT